MSDYTLRFPVVASDPRPLRDIAEAARQVADRTKTSAAAQDIFTKSLESSIQAGRSWQGALRDIQSTFRNTAPEVSNFTKLVRDQVDVYRKAASEAEVSSRRIETAFGRIGGRLGGGFAGGQLAGSLGGGMGLAIGGGLAVAGGFAAFIAAQTKQAEQIEQLAQRLQVSTRTALSFTRAADSSGGNVGSLEGAAERLSAALEAPTKAGQKTIETLQRLGIAFTETSGKARAGGQILEDVIRQLGKISDGSERAATAQDLLGRGGDKILPVVDAYGRLGDHLDQVAARMDRIAAQGRDAAAAWRALFDALTTWNGPGGDRPAGSYRGIPFPPDGRPRNPDGSLYQGPASESIASHRSQSARYRDNARRLGRNIGAPTAEDLQDSEATARIAFEQARSAAALAGNGGSVDDANYKRLNSDLETKRKAYEQARAAASGLRKGPSTAREVSQFAESLSSRDLDPITQVARRAAQFIVDRKISGNPLSAAQSGEIISAAGVGGQNILDKSNEETQKVLQKAQNDYAKDTNEQWKQVYQGLERSSKDILKDFEDMEKHADAVRGVGIDLQRGIGRGQRAANRSIGTLGLTGGAAARTGFNIDVQSAQSEFASEYKIAQAIEESDKRRLEIVKITGEYAKSYAQAELDLKVKTAEIEQQRKEALGGAFASLAISAQNGGAKGVQGFLRSQGEGLESKLLSNFAQAYIAPTILGDGTKAHPGIIPSIGNPKSTFGKLFAGILPSKLGDGADPVKDNTAKTVDNTTATTDLTKVMAQMYTAMTGQQPTGLSSTTSFPSFTGGVPGIGLFPNIPGLLAFGSDLNGITGSGPLSAVSALPGLFKSLGSLGGIQGTPGDTGGVGYANGDLNDVLGAVGGSGGSSSSGTSAFTKIGAIGGAALSAYKGIDDLIKGGAKRTAGGVGELLGSAASIAAIIPGGQVVAAGLGIAAGAAGLVSAILPDPRQQRINQISKTLFTSQYLAPQAINMSASTNGGYADFDEHGNLRTSNLSPYPAVSDPYLDVPRRTVVPGHTISPFGGGGNQTGAKVSQTPSYHVHVYALDSQSVIDRGSDIADALHQALNSSWHPVVKTLGQQLGIR